jgi:hypothetical protein
MVKKPPQMRLALHPATPSNRLPLNERARTDITLITISDDPVIFQSFVLFGGLHKTGTCVIY